jgi:hypothetical protein
MTRFVDMTNQNQTIESIQKYFVGAGLKRSDVNILFELCKNQDVVPSDLRIKVAERSNIHSDPEIPQYDIPQIQEKDVKLDARISFMVGLFFGALFFFPVNYVLWNVIDDGSMALHMAFEYGSVLLGLVIAKFSFSIENRLAAGFIVGNIILGLIEGTMGVWFDGNAFFITG